jgi:hypothetical protein
MGFKLFKVHAHSPNYYHSTSAYTVCTVKNVCAAWGTYLFIKRERYSLSCTARALFGEDCSEDDEDLVSTFHLV